MSEAEPSPKIARGVAYMKEHLDDPDLTVRDCAKAAFISEVYFRRLFRAAYGCAPQAYLIRLRIARAVGLMSGGYYSIKEVATLSGYRDYKYFSTEFKRIKVFPLRSIFTTIKNKKTASATWQKPFCVKRGQPK